MGNYKRFLGGITIFSLIFGVAGVFGLPAPVAHAATSPSMGATSDYAVISSTYTNSLNTGLETAITGDVCYTSGPGTEPVSIDGATVVPCPADVGTAQTAALADINVQAADPSCTDLGAGAVDLNAVDVGSGLGIFPPGCYTNGGAMNIVTGTTVTLDGEGTYIFKPGGELTTAANSTVELSGGASACDVFWAPVGSTTIGANAATSPTPTFVGNIFRGDADGLSITLGHFANLLGRTLAFGSTVTTDSNTITVPDCPVETTPDEGDDVPLAGTVTVVKTVINDNGGTAVVDDFDLFFDGEAVVSGETNSYIANPSYQVSETVHADYSHSFSGDCDEDGIISVSPGDVKFCVITNDDIGEPVVTPPVPPLIDVVKVPNPWTLSDGAGPVTYTYTLRNIGTVPVTDVTMVGDSCSPVTLISGDADSDSELDVDETWTYTCSTTLEETHTNTITATGWANGLSAVDVASATVVVNESIVPPLIHVTKVPSPLTLAAGGGMVTYTVTLDNPGTVPLANVNVDDDKCGTMTYVSGDTNEDDMLDVSEEWIYTCEMNVTGNTVNTVTVTGDANGLTATDLAVAPVLVAGAVPALPVTGASSSTNTLVLVLAAVAISASVLMYVARKKM